MLKVLIKIANKIPCWKYLCSTSFLINRLMHLIAQIQLFPQLLRNLFAREFFVHLSPSSGHWSIPWSSQQQEQLSMSEANHCVRSSRVICRSVIPKINFLLYIYIHILYVTALNISIYLISIFFFRFIFIIHNNFFVFLIYILY